MAARRERWGRILSEAEAAGLPIREYCRKHDLHEGQFYHWRHILELEARRSKPGKEPGFVLVRAAGEARPETEAGALELVLDRGWRLRIPSGVDEASLRAVLSALAARA
jgi:hypothetical protein